MTDGPVRKRLGDWSRDGNYIVYEVFDPETEADLWYLERTEDGSGWEPHPFLDTPSNEQVAKLSPDGRYVAYVSDESGQDEVYVQPFPEGGRRWTVSNNGGMGHRWSGDGDELFYVEGTDTLMAVEVSTEGEFSAGTPHRLFRHPGLIPGSYYPRYDISKDGQRFLTAEAVAGETAQRSIQVVENWFAEFRGRQ